MIERSQIDEWQATLTAVLSHPAFGRAERHRRLLGYLVEAALAGAEGRLKETAIALDVFGRDPARYDPRRDAIVRVEMRRLRKRLAQAQRDGDAPCSIEVPLGGYAPVLSMRAAGRDAARDRWRWPIHWPASGQRLALLPVQGAQSSDALYEALLASLSTLTPLRLISTLANRHVPLEAEDVAVLAHRLGADLLLEALAHRESGQVVLRLRLVSGKDGLQLALRELTLPWPAADGWADDLSQRAVDALSPWLSGPPLTTPSARMATSPEADRCLQQARRLARQATPDSEARAVRLLERALHAQPNHARARMQLAILHGNAANRDVGHFERRIWLARGHAEQAVRLDPADVDARALLAWYRYLTDLALDDALADLAALVEQAPRSRLVFHAYGALCSHTGRTDEAVRSFGISGELEPMDVNPLYAAALALLNGHRGNEALALLDQVLELEPAHLYAKRWRAEALASVGAHAMAEAALVDLESTPGMIEGEIGFARGCFAAWRGEVAAADAAFSSVDVERYMARVPAALAVRDVHAGRADEAHARAIDLAARRDARLVYLFSGRNGAIARRDERIERLARGLGWMPLRA